MQPTSGTLVPAVVDALVAAWSTAFPTATVVDGPFGPLLMADAVIAVGAGNVENAEPYRVEVDDYGMGGRHHESGAVRCEIAVAWGNSTVGKPSRDAVAAILAAIDAAFREDSTLGGVCDVVRLGSQRWMHWREHDENDEPTGAAIASCQFDVEFGGWL